MGEATPRGGARVYARGTLFERGPGGSKDFVSGSAQRLLRGMRPPSQGGPPVPPVQLDLPSAAERPSPSPAPATPFSQVVSAFGQTAGIPTFGQPSPASGPLPGFGSVQMSSPAFPQNSSSGGARGPESIDTSRESAGQATIGAAFGAPRLDDRLLCARLLR